MKTKAQMRKEAVERLRHAVKHQTRGPLCADDVTEALVGDGWAESSVEEDVEIIIDLLTDDEMDSDNNAYAMGPRDADGILWFRGDMSDSEWGVIERTYFDGERWMVCGHDISAPWIPADSIRHAPMRTATQRESDMMLLPRDEDGEVIHIGDELQWDDGERLTVIGVGNDIVFYVNDDGLGGAQWTKANNKRHYHKPTIEDVLREFAEKVTDSQIPGTHPTYEEAIAEYAKRMQLKEDE